MQEELSGDFVPNGLLSSLKSAKRPLDAAAAVDRPLLDSTGSSSLHDTITINPFPKVPLSRAESINSSGPTTSPLKPNGLLGSRSGGESSRNVAGRDASGGTHETGVHFSADESIAGPSTYSDDISSLNASSLRPNGLLGSFRSRNSQGDDDPFPSLEPLPQTQDDALPDVADLLRPYAKSSRAKPRSEAASSVHLPRSSVRAYTYEGKPVFIKRRSRLPAGTSTNPKSANRDIGKLLDIPIHRLLDGLSVTTARKLAAEPEAGPKHDSSDMLWVDRYRPNKYTDLLGDERVHREVLSWVKEWDVCVFGKHAKNRGKKRARDEDERPQDLHHRPLEKILLLSGPPGLGKTTLAHVVAKQAGYNVFEINASDARSAQAVEERIRPAVEAGYSVCSPLPNLVIIDEIDGATGGGESSAGFIQKLVQLALEKPTSGQKKKKGQKGKPVLLRPIICICNDLNAQPLAKLRPIARIIRFSKAADVLLVKRLRYICETEGLSADTRALSTLVGLAQGDMRGCLNTLQFIKARNKPVTEPVVRTATAGLKEADTNFQSIMSDLFAPISKKRIKELGLSESDDARYVDRLSRQLDSSGVLDRVALGCFEHYAKIHQHDATFARYLKGNEWLLSYDVLSGSMHMEREYALLPYLSYSLVPYYPLFQERGGPRVERPKEYWDHYNQTKTNEEIHRSLAHGARSGSCRVNGAYRSLVSEPVSHLEFTPYLNRIINPPLRPINKQVIRPEEKDVLSRLVGIMSALELNFIQEKAEDGQLVYRLDPPIDVFVTYDGKRASDIGPSRYAVRQLVATELETQASSRPVNAAEDAKVKRTKDAHEPDDTADTSALERGEGRLTRAAGDVPAAKRVKADISDPVDRPAVDFFGRPIVAKPASARKPTSSAGLAAWHQREITYRASFRFKEGNSAAVRKPVKMVSFL